MGALLLASLASADEFTVSGNAMAGFNAQAAANSNTFFGLTYSGSTFSGTSAGGFLAMGGNPNPGANLNNFGSLSLSGQSHLYNGNTFTLLLTFTTPTGIAGGGSTSFTAAVLGQVVNVSAGGVNINFGANSTHTYTFANATSTGTFTLNLNNVAINPGQTSAINGFITGTAQAVPEPSVLAGVGLGVVALVRRRIRKQPSA